MRFQIQTFLAAYRSKFICLNCLAVVTERGADDVRDVVMGLVAERRVETQIGECLNCGSTEPVVRHGSHSMRGVTLEP